MVNRRSDSDASTTAPLHSVAPVVKRKRQVSCLGEQERRERKRAIDREAQRSLREKTKTHIAELERTIEILRNQDRNGATASLLNEIEGLRAENERLRDVIDGVRSVIGGEMFGKMTPTAPASAGVSRLRLEENTPMDENAGPASTGLRRGSISYSQAATDAKLPPSLPSPESTPLEAQYPSASFGFNPPMPATSRTVDLDGMTMISVALPTSSDLSLALDDVTNGSTHEEALMPTPVSPATAAFAPFIQEMELFGRAWHCPSPLVLHINDRNDDRPSSSSSSSQVPSFAVCPIWRKSNELFSKIFSSRTPSSTEASSLFPGHDLAWSMEAGLLFQGIKDGWKTFDSWKQSPVLQILKAVDQFLFAKSGKMERLAASYKSFKLLKYYLNPTQAELDKVPTWLRPSPLQSSTAHPIAIDMFAWPPLRNRLVHRHHALFRNSQLSRNYARFLRFDWPFSFEDTFYRDDAVGGWLPSPLFERYHGDVRSWTVEERFWEGLEELRGDIEGCGAV
ncbi:hypothetical protein PMIN06_010895 [Paraphaeosphaeria minitans]|uniref:BZIP transcription factor n=1 Tax=Paraphaeosphaeria minitans TaxID=565426 RepID=A0A9P6GGS8_9PLEO|nr:hypothetical protein PMIN01_06747 [Paraphaeosphaeria minitans]